MSAMDQDSVVWIEPWVDTVTESAGVEVREPYVERYWTSVIGPTQTLLLRVVADELDRSPGGFGMCQVDMARQLGVSPNNGGKGIAKAFERLEMFRLASRGHSLWAVRRSVPVLSPAQLRRLPEPLRRSHRADAAGAVAVWGETAAARAAQVAMEMAEAGQAGEAIRRRLRALRLPPSVCVEAARLAVVEASAEPAAPLEEARSARGADRDWPAASGM